MATWAATSFCTVADVRARAPEIDAPTNRGNEASGDTLLTAKIALAKDLMRQDVLVRFGKAMPSGVEQWIDRARGLSDSRAEQRMSEYAKLGRDPSDSDFYADGHTSAAGRRILPQTYSFYGTPTNGTSGTNAGYAENGARLVDTKYSLLYINRGTLASPTWERVTPEQMIDYITNPTELKHTCVALTLQLVYEDRLHRFTANHEAGVEHYASFMNLFKAEYHRSLDAAFPLLTVDLSNDGTVDEFERNVNRATKYFA